MAVELQAAPTPTLAGVPLDKDIARQLERATAKVESAAHDRDRLILLAYASGASLRDIAVVVGLTHVGVKKLIERVQPDYVIVDAEGNTVAIVEAKASDRADLTLDQLQRRGSAE